MYKMSNDNMRDMWIMFITSDKYKQYFVLSEEVWTNNLEQVKKYIDEHKKKPSKHDKNFNLKDAKLCFFFKKKWSIPGLFFFYFRLFNTVEGKQMFHIKVC